jgi:hypothetical protein
MVMEILPVLVPIQFVLYRLQAIVQSHYEVLLFPPYHYPSLTVANARSHQLVESNEVASSDAPPPHPQAREVAKTIEDAKKDE